MVRAPLRRLIVAACATALMVSLTAVGSAGAAVTRPHTVLRGACGLDLRVGFSHCNLKLLGNLKRQPLAAAAPAGGYGPADIQSAYKLPAGGAGQTVAIVDAYDDKTAAADLNAYRSTYGLPPRTTASGCFKKVNQNGVQGSYPSNNQGWALEVSLDLDMVSATCPSCHILLVEATSNANTNLYAAVEPLRALGRTRSPTATAAPSRAPIRRATSTSTTPDRRSPSPPATAATAWSTPPRLPT